MCAKRLPLITHRLVPFLHFFYINPHVDDLDLYVGGMVEDPVVGGMVSLSLIKFFQINSRWAQHWPASLVTNSNVQGTAIGKCLIGLG